MHHINLVGNQLEHLPRFIPPELDTPGVIYTPMSNPGNPSLANFSRTAIAFFIDRIQINFLIRHHGGIMNSTYYC